MALLNHELFLLLPLLLTMTGNAMLVPAPKGPFSVTFSTMEFVDNSRTENPFNQSTDPRAFMASLFYPFNSEKTCTKRYMPPLTAAASDEFYASLGIKNGTFESLELEVPCQNSSENIPVCPDHFPLVLFSPAFSASRFLYNSILQNVASHGYIIASIDHPFDGAAVEFPDGIVIKKPEYSLNESQLEFDVVYRTQDTRFLLDQLSNPEVIQRLLPSFPCREGLRTDKVAMFGHSLGGATTLSAMLNDSRIVGGIDLDGGLFGPVIEAGLNRPVLFFASQTHNHTVDENWRTIYPRLTSFKREIAIEGLLHEGYSDAPLIGELLGLSQSPAFQATVGIVSGQRVIDIISRYAPAFFNMVFEGEYDEILERPSDDFSEVVFLQT